MEAHTFNINGCIYIPSYIKLAPVVPLLRQLVQLMHCKNKTKVYPAFMETEEHLALLTLGIC
jgi:hypothetical protein